MLAQWQEKIRGLTGISPETQGKIIVTLLVISIIWLVRSVVVHIVWKRTDDPRIRYVWRKGANYVAIALILLVGSSIWLENLKDLSTFLGLLSAGIAIALKDLIASFAGWVYIIVRRPFEVGDRMQAGEHAGDVIDISLFQFTLMEIGNWVDADQSTGRVIHLPNSLVFTGAIANYHKGFQYIWNELAVLVTFESNWKKAKELLQGIADKNAAHTEAEAKRKVREASKRYMIFYSNLTPRVYTSVRDCGVLISVRYLCDPRRRRNTAEAIWENILTEFAQCHDIDFAYPTQRFYNNRLEGKPEAGGPAMPGDGHEPPA